MPHALVIDDSALIRQRVGDIVESAGFRVTKAEDGQQAFDAFFADDFDVVVCDIIMPVCDGIEFTRRIRERDEETPIIMVTSVADEEFIARAKDAGASSYLLKPVNEQVLLQRLEDLVPAHAGTA
jgi:CheY-like chemotaxis protein